MSAISVKHLELKLGDKMLCKSLSQTFSSGECWCVMGRNGSGKTTLLHTLAGISSPSSGQVWLQDKLISNLSRRRIAKRLALLFQDHHDPFPATVMETALTGRHPHLGPWAWEDEEDIEIVLQTLRFLGLAGLEERSVTSLSGGERRRLGIATLLVQDTEILLLDEPTNHLDMNHSIQALELLSALAKRENKTIILTLHDLNLATRFADHFLFFMDAGEVCAGPAQEMLRQDLLEKVFGHPLVPVRGMDFPAWLPA